VLAGRVERGRRRLGCGRPGCWCGAEGEGEAGAAGECVDGEPAAVVGQLVDGECLDVGASADCGELDLFAGGERDRYVGEVGAEDGEAADSGDRGVEAERCPDVPGGDCSEVVVSGETVGVCCEEGLLGALDDLFGSCWGAEPDIGERGGETRLVASQACGRVRASAWRRSRRGSSRPNRGEHASSHDIAYLTVAVCARGV
jgi:hypothetical protein